MVFPQTLVKCQIKETVAQDSLASVLYHEFLYLGPRF
jgi:hypothetical protein